MFINSTINIKHVSILIFYFSKFNAIVVNANIIAEIIVSFPRKASLVRDLFLEKNVSEFPVINPLNPSALLGCSKTEVISTIAINTSNIIRNVYTAAPP
jgi:hypothetical protein